MFNIKKSGFTLIELLVVISIIGILATIVYASFDEARKQSRDKTRLASLKELQLAVELYKSQYGVYPARGCGITGLGEWTSPGPGTGTWYNACDQYISGLVPDFIGSLPKDPRNENDNNNGFLYQVSDDGTMYKILIAQTVETLFVDSFDHEFARCPYAFGYAPCNTAAPQTDIYAVYSSGAEGW